MQEMHDAPMARHYGEKTTRELCVKTFYWPKVKEGVKIMSARV